MTAFHLDCLVGAHVEPGVERGERLDGAEVTTAGLSRWSTDVSRWRRADFDAPLRAMPDFKLRSKCGHLLLLATLTACGARTDLLSPDALDAGNPIDAALPPDAAACSIVGTWEFTYQGSSSFYRFAASGSYTGDTTLAGLDSGAPPWVGTYTFAAGLLRFVDGGCDAAYSLAFDAACDRADARMVSDSCTGSIYDVPYTFTRVP